MLDAGELTPEEARSHPRRNVVTRALGTGGNAEAEYWMLPAEEGDRMLVCSDGLPSEVRDEAIVQILSEVENAQPAADALLQAALDNGGRDNISVVVVDAGPAVSRRPGGLLCDFAEFDESTIEVAIPVDSAGGKQ